MIAPACEELDHKGQNHPMDFSSKAMDEKNKADKANGHEPNGTSDVLSGIDPMLLASMQRNLVAAAGGTPASELLRRFQHQLKHNNNDGGIAENEWDGNKIIDEQDKGKGKKMY